MSHQISTACPCLHTSPISSRSEPRVPGIDVVFGRTSGILHSSPVTEDSFSSRLPHESAARVHQTPGGVLSSRMFSLVLIGYQSSLQCLSIGLPIPAPKFELLYSYGAESGKVCRDIPSPDPRELLTIATCPSSLGVIALHECSLLWSVGHESHAFASGDDSHENQEDRIPISCPSWSWREAVDLCSAAGAQDVETSW